MTGINENILEERSLRRAMHFSAMVKPNFGVIELNK